MHIKPNTWHQRMYAQLSGNDYDVMQYLQRNGRLNFCKYARVVAIGLILATFAATAALFFLMCLGATWWLSIAGIPWIDVKHPDFFFAGAAQCGLVFHIMGFVGLIVWGSVRAINGYKEMKRQRAYEERFGDKPKEPGFLATWYKSVKHRFCPMMTFDPETQIQ